jgi:multiple sugar transport system permease protein
VPGAADAFGIFLARQFILTAVPTELLEAAKLDGGGEWSIFTRVVLPLCRPLLAALGIITFTYLWNDFFGPLIYFNKSEVFTLPIGLQNLSLPRGQLLQGVQMAGGFLVTLPMAIVFIALQKQFIGSLTAAALKG